MAAAAAVAAAKAIVLALGAAVNTRRKTPKRGNKKCIHVKRSKQQLRWPQGSERPFPWSRALRTSFAPYGQLVAAEAVLFLLVATQSGRFRIASTMSSLVLVCVAVGFVLLIIEASLEEAE